jgi:hypothetical protein
MVLSSLVYEQDTDDPPHVLGLLPFTVVEQPPVAPPGGWFAETPPPPTTNQDLKGIVNDVRVGSQPMGFV